MKIDIRDLLEYLECPMRHMYRHIEHVKPRSWVKGNGLHTGSEIYKEFDEALHKMATFIFLMVEADRYPSLYTMKQKWGSIWITHREGHMDAVQEIVSWRNERRKKEKLGLRVITDLLEAFREKPGLPILVGKPYEVQIGRHTLTGTIDLVREINGEIELMDWKLDDRPTTLHRRNDLEVTAAVYAYRKIVRSSESRIVYHGLLSGKQEETCRDEKDFKKLETALDYVERAIDSGIFYPVLNFKCYECPFDLHCAKREW